jgi:hypothetical protein
MKTLVRNRHKFSKQIAKLKSANAGQRFLETFVKRKSWTKTVSTFIQFISQVQHYPQDLAITFHCQWNGPRSARCRSKLAIPNHGIVVHHKDVISHVKYWAQTKDGVLFRMANRDIQANFRDHTKLVIEAVSRSMFYDTGHGVKQVTMAELNDQDRFHDVRKRFALVKEMAQHFV